MLNTTYRGFDIRFNEDSEMFEFTPDRTTFESVKNKSLKSLKREIDKLFKSEKLNIGIYINDFRGITEATITSINNTDKVFWVRDCQKHRRKMNHVIPKDFSTEPIIDQIKILEKKRQSMFEEIKKLQASLDQFNVEEFQAYLVRMKERVKKSQCQNIQKKTGSK